MKKKDKKLIVKLESYQLKAEDRVKYSLERLDILIISLSSGGLLLGLNLFKNFNDVSIDKNFIKLSWLSFSLALILNLFSQATGYLANKYDIKGVENDINRLSNKELEGNQKRNDIYQRIYDYLTISFNILSFISLVVGIILLVLFINLKV
ncbi:MAG: hypothetical protein ACPGSD_12915 [Flavobacteriales bacterium]